jgi:hypothetical protein
LPVKCETCERPAGEAFGFCASCGEPLCRDCLGGFWKGHSEEKISGVPGLLWSTTTLTLKLPICEGCFAAHDRAQRLAKKGYWRNALIIALIFFAPLFLLYLNFWMSLNPGGENYFILVFVAVVLFIFGFIIGIGASWVIKRSIFKKALIGKPFMYKSRLFCPSCGKYKKKDLFGVVQAAMDAQEQQRGFWESALGPSDGSAPDYYYCSKCGYLGPLGPAMGIRVYRQKHGRVGRESLRGTIWQQLAEGPL